jgi:hypothetical protein
MVLTRVTKARALDGFHVEITLTTGEVVERDLRPFLTGPIFESIRADESQFRQVRAQDGTLVWPNGADLCPDVVIWGGVPPGNSDSFAA